MIHTFCTLRFDQFFQMESSDYFIIEALVRKIKDEMLSSLDVYSFVSPSAYDTAWLAMVPDPEGGNDGRRPMFEECLNWVANNQSEGGFWGESDGYGSPAIDCLPATLACMVALKSWGVGSANLERGLAFIHANTVKLLAENHGSCPRWFAIVFPAMVELAQEKGLEIVCSDEMEKAVTSISYHSQLILEREEFVDKYHYPPLLSDLQTLPSWYGIDEKDRAKHMSEDGSIFQSPSATACAFMTSQDSRCMSYLQALVQRFPHGGVPPMYPMDEQLIQLRMVDILEKLGLADHFHKEIEKILQHVYCTSQEELPDKSLVPIQLYKDSLAFRLLRMYGYHVSPMRFCWFLNHEDILGQMEKDCEHFSSVMYNVYGATDLSFSGEYEVQEARSFAGKLLEKALSLGIRDDNTNAMFPNFRTLIKNELDLPWMARLDHLDHRMWIEHLCGVNSQWAANASFYTTCRLSSFQNEALILELAVKNYEFRQAIYKSELEELRRWCADWGLIDMGFGRGKTTYCYFVVAAACTFLPYDSEVRMIIAKSGILIVVADDFFDGKGSLDELENLTEAVRRWNGVDLRDHSKNIFNALDNLVSGMAEKYLRQHGKDIAGDLQAIWCETFASWLEEAKWSKSGYIPSLSEYLDNAGISVAAHSLVLPASCFLSASLPEFKLKPFNDQYQTITKLLMDVSRLLNDTQTYRREQKEGKLNFVLLYLKENPTASIEDSISFMKGILDEKRREFLERILMKGLDDLPRPCKLLHLSCFKVFQMCYNSTNRFDSDTELLHDINKAIYVPLKVQKPRPLNLKLPAPHHANPKKENSKINVAHNFNQTFKPRGIPGLVVHRILPKVRNVCGKAPNPLKPCFI